MIILRYLLREVLVTTLVITLVLFLLSFGSRFAQYLEEAAQGRFAAEVLFSILGYRVPQFLVLIIPISFFIAILLSFGRLYVDSEMVVLSSCGVSKRRLLWYSMIPALVVAAVVALLSLSMAPLGTARSTEIQNQQKNRSELTLLKPNRFQPYSGGRFEVHFENFGNAERTVIEKVFIAEMNQNGSGGDRSSVMTAARGREHRLESGQTSLLLEDVFRYYGKPGQPDYLREHSDRIEYLLDTDTYVKQRARDIEGIPTPELWRSDALKHKAELHWRIGLPLVVLVSTLIAVPLSYTNPRQGRYFKLFPALMLIIAYILLLSIGKTKIEGEEVSLAFGLWWVHGIFLFIALMLLLWNNGQHLGKWKRSAIQDFHVQPETVKPVGLEVYDAKT